MAMIQVTGLFIHPVKSMKGIALTQSDALATGLRYDRIFMVTTPDGRFITAREKPELLKLKTVIHSNGITIESPYQQKIFVKYDDFSFSLDSTEVWGNHFSSHISSINVNRFLSDFLQKEVQLRWIGHQSNRRVKHYPTVPIGFADGHPYLLINRASFDYVQKQCPESLNIEQFRGNIIIDGALPFAEDGWQSIKIGQIVFDLVKPCSRCIMLNVDLVSHQNHPNKEPLTTLSHFRQDEVGDIDFGMKMIARNEGTISIDDPVEILKRKPAKTYLKKIAAKKTESKNNFDEIIQSDNSLKTIIPKIYIGEKVLTANTQYSILEQLEDHGISVPYSCRSGFCGRCEIQLEEGEVTPMLQSAIKQNGRILACSCIPKSKIIRLKI